MLIPTVLIATSIPLVGEQRAVGLFVLEDNLLFVAQEEETRHVLLIFLNDSLELSKIERIAVQPDKINDAAIVGERLILAGHSSPMPRHSSIYVCSLQLDGKILKQELLHFSGAMAWAEALVCDTEAIFLVGGYNTLKKAWFDALLVRLDWNLRIVWSKTSGGLSDDWFHNVKFVDSQLLCVGASESKTKGKADAMVLLYDRNGRKLFERTVGGPDWDKAIDAVESKDRLYVLAWTNSYTPHRSGLLIEMTRSGKLIDQHLLDLGSDFSPSCLFAVDDGLLVCGTVWNNETRFDPTILFLDENKKLVQKIVVALPNDQSIRGVVRHGEKIFLYGESDNPITGKDPFLLAFDLALFLSQSR